MNSKFQRQGNMNFAESLRRRDLMPNSGTLHPLSVINGARVASLERRNDNVNITNTPRQGSQAGKEKLDIDEEPTETVLATKSIGGDAVDGGFRCGHGHQTTAEEVGCNGNRDRIGQRRTDVLRHRGGVEGCQRSFRDQRRTGGGDGRATAGCHEIESEKDKEMMQVC
ncbi:hypothetical protein AHAS_Ahas01G0047400 [Arachis hypogaea]